MHIFSNLFCYWYDFFCLLDIDDFDIQSTVHHDTFL